MGYSRRLKNSELFPWSARKQQKIFFFLYPRDNNKDNEEKRMPYNRENMVVGENMSFMNP